jgi:hypothetical protein
MDRRGILREGVKPIDAARAFRLLSIFFVFSGLFLHWVTARKLNHNADVMDHPVTAEGQITYVKLTGRGAPSLGYAYDALGAHYSDVTEPSVLDGYASNPQYEPRVGDSIAVIYSATHPSWSMAGDLRRQPYYSLELTRGMSTIGLIGFVISQFLILWLSKRADNRQIPSTRQQIRANERREKKAGARQDRAPH